MQSFGGLNLNDGGAVVAVKPVVLVTFRLKGRYVLEVALQCTTWNLRSPLVFYVHYFDHEFYFVVRDRIVDLIALSGANVVYVCGIGDYDALNRIIGQNSRKITCQILDIKAMGFKMNDEAWCTVGMRCHCMHQWLMSKMPYFQHSSLGH